MHMAAARRAEETTRTHTTSKTALTSSATPVPSVTPTDTANPNDGSSSTSKTWVIVLIIVLAAVAISLIYAYTRVLRYRNPNPKYLPAPLKSLWRRWTPRSKYGRVFGSSVRSNLPSRGPQYDGNTAYDPSISTSEAPGSHSLTETHRAPPTDPHSTSHINNSTTQSESTVNRNTSVRSIMTLPPYHAAPLPSERLIAREGERAGVDTVLEFPETAEEEEAQREEDMEALYQIRQARRRELEERELRRGERRVAREQGDWARLEQLRLESQARARARAQHVVIGNSSDNDSAASLPPASTNSATLFAEHAARASSRERRVSSVSYAALGIARHDGSRIRADSVDSSDERPLLDSAASMGRGGGGARGSNEGSRRSSYTTLPRPPNLSGYHQRNISTSSAFSHDEDVGIPTPAGSSDRQNSDGNGHQRPPVILTPQSSGEGTPPQPRRGEEEEEEERERERERPPEYDLGEAPPYTSPTTDRRGGDDDDDDADAPFSGLPPIQPVPSIEVTATTPITPGGGVGGAGTAGR